MSLLIVENNPKSPISEAYRTLRTNIQFSSLDKELKTILITSSVPREGKTNTSGNLALSATQTGKKVLLIDCDLRDPSLHKVFRISNEKGLTDMLRENLKLEDIAGIITENLHVLTSGTIPSNPSELISSEKMKIFLKEVRGRYDTIIIDSPPLINVTDAQILAANSDGVVLVIGSREVPIKACKKSIELLKNVNANLLGVVLNKVDSKSGIYSNYNYSYNNKNDKTKKEKKVRNKRRAAKLEV